MRVESVFSLKHISSVIKVPYFLCKNFDEFSAMKVEAREWEKLVAEKLELQRTVDELRLTVKKLETAALCAPKPGEIQWSLSPRVIDDELEIVGGVKSAQSESTSKIESASSANQLPVALKGEDEEQSTSNETMKKMTKPVSSVVLKVIKDHVFFFLSM